MILLLDIGNSRLKWTWSDGSTLPAPQAAEHGGDPAARIAALEGPRARAVWISQVMGPAHETAIAQAVQRRCGVAPEFARSEAAREGLTPAYAEPARLGVDRWLSMLALWTRLRGPFCVVNAGTALTLDAVDAQGRHLGGIIAPGLVTALNAIRGATRFELRHDLGAYTPGLGQDTESCVRQGALHACAGAIEHAARFGAGARFITGGDAQALLPHIGPEWTLQPHLVLDGLLAYARAAAGVPA